MSQEIKAKLTSRKFWAAVAGALAGILMVIYGILAGDSAVADNGAALIKAAVVVYPIAEGLVDLSRWIANAVKERTTTTKTIAATATDKATVQAVLSTEANKEEA